MARKGRKIPAYREHTPSGQAHIRINGKDHYLGKYGTPESHDRYDEIVAEFVVGAQPESSRKLTGVLAAWWVECKRRYEAVQIGRSSPFASDASFRYGVNPFPQRPEMSTSSD
jgi:hypothetical protein